MNLNVSKLSRDFTYVYDFIAMVQFREHVTIGENRVKIMEKKSNNINRNKEKMTIKIDILI